MFVIVTGGSGSGKSAYAEKRIMEFPSEKRYYLATMIVYGQEGRDKVERHRKLRAQKDFETIEKPVNVIEAAKEISTCNSVLLLECLSNLVANEMFDDNGQAKSVDEVVKKVVEDILSLYGHVEHMVVVTGEVFSDGATYEASTRDYINALGMINSQLARFADQVTEVVVGIPLRIK